MTTCVLAHRGGAREEGLEHGAGRTGMDAWEVARVGTDCWHDEPREPCGHPQLARGDAHRGDQAPLNSSASAPWGMPAESEADGSLYDILGGCQVTLKDIASMRGWWDVL